MSFANLHRQPKMSRLSRRLKLVLLISFCLVVVIGIAFMWLARGPEGTAVAIEMEERISAVAAECDLRLEKVVSVIPATVPLSARTSIKHYAKTIGRSTGICSPESDSAFDYVLGQANTGVEIHCLSRFSGDHLIGMDIRYVSAHHASGLLVRDAVRRQFQRDILSLTVTEKN